ncbi:post-GPI attachment to proteins factor 2-like [Diaphorina citri]|uniref:Post-GPI attachment to proteins factor 2-like n=1 Tax=Diaphorina citri TaxID=121845 RepID=A0A3Q0J0C5_DIACI|nr:post-GPI attachment to proteins factor 2-like [Diaphorina citri]
MDENENSSKESAKVVLYYSLPLRKLASTVVSLPLTALVVCFISAVLFQFDDVHETHFYEDELSHIFVSQFTALHENLFIVFMICSLLYMLVMLRVYRLAYPSMTSAQTYSFYTKLVLFVTSILATIGLVVFWFKHRRHCLDMAFSWFAICEYVIALSNMAYHMTVALDFPSEHLLIANGFSSSFLTSNHISQHVKHD